MLTGNPGKRPLNEDEPRPDANIPDCPPELGPVARAEWDRLVGELAALRLLTNLDRAALAAYCGAYALWADATVQIEKYGAMIKSPTGVSDPVALPSYRQPASGDHDAYRIRVRIHAGKPQPDRDTAAT
jgi:P27 family predicted phage terminase small subunit